MNKFVVLSCLDFNKEKESEYDGICVVLGCVTDPSFLLFFPVSKSNADVINYVLNDDEDKEYDINTDVLGIYQTMLDSWKAGDRFLSGVIMDLNYKKNKKEYSIGVKLALSNMENGGLESLVSVNFVHAILLAAMEEVDILMSDELIDSLLPEEEGLVKKDKSGFPDLDENENMLKAVKNIMSKKKK